MMQEAHSQMPALRISFGQARVRHNRIVRTKAGIKTLNKELQLTQAKTNALRLEYIQNFQRLGKINSERTHIQTHAPGIIKSFDV